MYTKKTPLLKHQEPHEISQASCFSKKKANSRAQKSFLTCHAQKNLLSWNNYISFAYSKINENYETILG